MTATARRGRRPGAPDTRAGILAAARAQFAAQGFTRTTIRGVAREAGVDPALVIGPSTDVIAGNGKILTAGAVDSIVSRGLVGVSGSTVVANLAPSRAAIRDGMATLCPLVSYVVAQLSAIDEL